MDQDLNDQIDLHLVDLGDRYLYHLSQGDEDLAQCVERKAIDITEALAKEESLLFLPFLSL